MCFPKLSFYYRQIESTDILIHVFLLKLQGGKKKSWKPVLPYAITNGETVCSQHYVY